MYFCVAGKRERLVIRKDDKGAAFGHMLEVLDVLMHCQELAVAGTVLLMSGAELNMCRKPGVAKRRIHAAARRRQLHYRRRL